MTPRRRPDGGPTRRPFSDPLDPFEERPRRVSRGQRGLEESARRAWATRHVHRLAAGHEVPPKRRWAIYFVLSVGITLVVWRLTHWIVWAYDPTAAVSYRITALPNPGGYAGRTPAEIAASGLATQPEPAAWIDPVGLALGLTLGLLLSWIYARYFQNL